MTALASWIAQASNPLRWAVLLALSAVFGMLFWLAHLPAAYLLGPMIAAIVVAVAGGAVKIDKRGALVAQASVGMMMAGSIPPDIMDEISKDWLLFVLGTLSVVAAAGVLGLSITRARIFPGTTAIWGSSPGAATVMVLMSESYGADMRLVAFMQYVRVVSCAAMAMLLVRLIGVPELDTVPAVARTVPVLPSLATFGAALVCAFAAPRLRLPGGALLTALIVGLGLSFSGLLEVVLPAWFLSICFAVVGLSVGMRFTPEVVRHAASAFPRVMMSVIILIATCGVFALALVVFADVDPLTAYLATTPGGADTVAIIATSTDVDVPFVMAMQIARFLFVVLTAPALARYLSRRAAD
ncbi:AbrB family transcriptional regulator [Falsirhodobacter sp. alg1]|uniref:AbrB family transcriptional regulator n=1 Tax=Falsirhodobacter sp. alg1 TaxID=1472418 RepID=UPI0005ED8E6A|nr:AbrB family transcriptional regulator [Falsirhodobacter sp. alg1]